MFFRSTSPFPSFASLERNDTKKGSSSADNKKRQTASTSSLLLRKGRSPARPPSFPLAAPTARIQFSVGDIPTKFPSPEQVELDVLEWWCHSALLRAPSHQVIQQRAEQAVVSLQRHFRRHSTPTMFSGRGRLWNRIALLTLVQDVCARPIDGPEGLESLSPNQWMGLQERLGQCRRGLLRSDANNHATTSEEEMPPSSSNEDDDKDDVAQLPLFQETYEDMKQLLQTHACVARFRQELQKLLSDANANNDDDDDEQPLLGPQQEPEKIDRNRLNEILRAYEDDLGAVENVPDRDTLLACLRNDLLRRPKKDSIQELPAKFLQELHKTTCDSKDLDVSYPALQASFQQLLRYWSEAVLKVPTLIQLGYGNSNSSSSLFRGKSSSGLNREQSNADAQSVSSWGMDEQEEAENRKMVNAEDDDDDDDDDPSDGYHTATEELEPSSSSPGNSVAGMRIGPRQPWQQDFAALDNLDPQSTPLVKNVSQKTTATTAATTTTATATTTATTTTATETATTTAATTAATTTTTTTTTAATATATATTPATPSKAGKQTKKKRPKQSFRKRPTAALKTIQSDGPAKRQGASSRVDELFISQPSGSLEKVAFPGSATVLYGQLKDGINNISAAAVEELDTRENEDKNKNNKNFFNDDQSLDGINNNNNNNSAAAAEELDIRENEDNNNNTNFFNDDQSLVPAEDTLDDEELSNKRPASDEARSARATSEEEEDPPPKKRTSEEEEEEDPPPKKKTRAYYRDATALEDISLSSSHDEDEDWVIGEEEDDDDDDDSEDQRILRASIPIHRDHVIEQSSDISTDDGMSIGGKATVSESDGGGDGEKWVPRSPVRVLSPGLRKSPRLKGHRRSVGTPNSTTSIVPWPDSSSDEEDGPGLRMMMRERLPSLGSILSNRSRRNKRGML